MSDNERAAILPTPTRLPPPDRPPVTVSIGTSELARSSVFVSELVSMVNRAYGKGRIGDEEARHRLRAGDERPHRNRVLHIAMRDGQLVGCCSSSLFVPWCGPGCGRCRRSLRRQLKRCCRRTRSQHGERDATNRH